MEISLTFITIIINIAMLGLGVFLGFLGAWCFADKISDNEEWIKIGSEQIQQSIDTHEASVAAAQEVLKRCMHIYETDSDFIIRVLHSCTPVDCEMDTDPISEKPLNMYDLSNKIISGPEEGVDNARA